MSSKSVGRLRRGAFVLVVCAAALGAALGQGAPGAGVRPEWRAALERVSAESMRGHLSFIASDALEGRATPSRGLDLAAEYIAAQFRRAGLEPAGGDGSYFQTANWELVGRDTAGFEMRLADGGRSLSLDAAEVSLGVSAGGFHVWPLEEELSLDGAGLYKVAYGDAAQQAALTREQLAGRVVVSEVPDFRRAEGPRRFAAAREVNSFLARMRALGAPLVISFDRAPARGGGGSPPRRLVDPEAAGGDSPLGPEPTAPLAVVHGERGAQFFAALPAGATAARLTFRSPAQARTPARLRNVAGLLRGSDPQLRDTYVIVSAHYDHTGLRENCAAGDCIYNGANDDGSGTVAVMELAAALSKLEPKPRRSVLFLTFFGEELGLVGSRYYGRHPLVPLRQTVAQINLEQVGRTDDEEGPQVGTATVTGFDYTGVGETLRRAGEEAGVKVYKHPTKSDSFFSRSDNQALADLGVPAHTVGTAFEFPDYHGVGDHWEKIDYANMERVVRAVGLGLLRVADDPQAPRWDETNPRTARYVEAWKKLHGR